MDFGMQSEIGGPMITGRWTNVRTGDEVVVRDSFMDGDDMVIFTTDGRQFTLDQFQDFVQMSDEEYDEHGNVLSNSSNTNISSKPVSSNHKTPNLDAATIFAGMEENKGSVVELVSPEPTAEFDIVDGVTKDAAESPNTDSGGLDAASKVISKTSCPKFKITFEWPDFPIKELNMCKEFFDTTNDDIIKAIIERHCNEHMLEKAMVEWLIEELKK